MFDSYFWWRVRHAGFAKRFRRSGIEVVRQLIPQSEAAWLATTCTRAYEAIASGLGSDEIRSNVESWGGMGVDHLISVIGDAETINGILQRACNRASWLLGRPLEIVRPVVNIRRHGERPVYTGWHIDAQAALTAQYDPCFNIWLPLSPVGWTLPSLSFVAGSHEETRDPSMAEKILPSPPDSWFDATFHGERITPKLSPGDVAIFDHYMLHRTQPLPMQGNVRLAIELRVRDVGKIRRIKDTLLARFSFLLPRPESRESGEETQ